MIGGRSSSRGILLYDQDKKGTNSVYGYYDERDEIVLVEGPYSEMAAMQSEQAKPDYSAAGGFGISGLTLLILGVIIWKAYISGSVLCLVVASVYSLLSFYPMLGLLSLVINIYKTRELRKQLRRFHGCEHAMIGYHQCCARLKLVWEADKLRRYSIFCADCGTAHIGYNLYILTVAAWLICQIPSLGLWKAAGLLVCSLILLLVLYLIPMNPFKLLEIPIVAKPKERELRLGVAILDRFSELEQSAC